MNKYFLLIFVLFFACKNNTTSPLDNDIIDDISPVITFTINEGYEVSNEINLIFEITDSSEIDSTILFLDNNRIAVYSSAVDSLTFDLSPYAIDLPDPESLNKYNTTSDIIDYERSIFVEAVDSEGNRGKSDVKKIVITEYPGWRKYYCLEDSFIPRCFLVDDNNLIWIGSGTDGVIVYDPTSGYTRNLTIPTTVNNNVIYDFELIEESRVWIASENNASEYDYDLDQWLQILTPPENNSGVDGDGNPVSGPNSVHAVAFDNDNNLYIGTGYDDLFRYNGAEFTRFKIPGYRIFPMDVHPDGTIYYSTNWGPQSYLHNDTVHEYNYPGDGKGVFNLSLSLLIDSHGDVWFDAGYNGIPGCYVYDGADWQTIYTGNANEIIYPSLCDDNGVIYTELGDVNNIFEGYEQKLGIATYDGEYWTYWRDLPTPFNIENTDKTNIPSISNKYSLETLIGKAPNGDIWMIIDNVLWRYRPSLGGYP